MRIADYKNKTIGLVITILFISILLDSCKKEVYDTTTPSNSIEEESHIIHLVWYQNDTETKKDIEAGLKWCFSFLGAELPKNSMSESLNWEEHNKIRLDIRELKFNKTAVLYLEKLMSIMKQSQEYKIKGGIDVGRFVVTIFNNSHHYYKIVGIPPTLPAFESEYLFQNKRAGILESGVSKGHRRIRLPRELNYTDLGFIAEELTDDINNANSKAVEFEVLDLMPNGQQRFAVYNHKGELISGADQRYSAGGKPAKCLWCHETDISRAFVSTTSASGFYSIAEFDSIINQCNEVVKKHRKTLHSDLDYNKRQEHTQLEKLYIRFMEPSAKRLASEWNTTEEAVRKKLEALPTHTHNEFPEMGTLYFRSAVTDFTPFSVVPIPAEARENKGFEPNLL